MFENFIEDKLNGIGFDAWEHRTEIGRDAFFPIMEAMRVVDEKDRDFWLNIIEIERSCERGKA